ncbi:hypothetical protein KFE25_011100 [Diacronema lutheri]|uniref:Uncharacterized protein n=1 Tax=Diacronema lutheri TaxID=2081491 RepID=A0A8J6CD26_DIALT|nr:hypothetical protein KFE25_011100 [Diacronema lutheri]
MMAVFLPTLAFASRPLPTHPHLHEPLGSPAFVSLDHPHVLEPLGSPALAALAALTDSSGLAELALPRTERLAPPAAEPRLAREEWPWFVAQPDATEQVADPFSARVAREEAKRARVPAWPTGATLRLSPPPPPPLARRSRPRARALPPCPPPPRPPVLRPPPPRPPPPRPPPPRPPPLRPALPPSATQPPGTHAEPRAEQLALRAAAGACAVAALACATWRAPQPTLALLLGALISADVATDLYVVLRWAGLEAMCAEAAGIEPPSVMLAAARAAGALPLADAAPAAPPSPPGANTAIAAARARARGASTTYARRGFAAVGALALLAPAALGAWDARRRSEWLDALAALCRVDALLCALRVLGGAIVAGASGGAAAAGAAGVAADAAARRARTALGTTAFVHAACEALVMCYAQAAALAACTAAPDGALAGGGGDGDGDGGGGVSGGNADAMPGASAAAPLNARAGNRPALDGRVLGGGCYDELDVASLLLSLVCAGGGVCAFALAVRLRPDGERRARAASRAACALHMGATLGVRVVATALVLARGGVHAGLTLGAALWLGAWSVHALGARADSPSAARLALVSVVLTLEGGARSAWSATALAFSRALSVALPLGAAALALDLPVADASVENGAALGSNADAEAVAGARTGGSATVDGLRAGAAGSAAGAGATTASLAATDAYTAFGDALGEDAPVRRTLWLVCQSLALLALLTIPAYVSAHTASERAPGASARDAPGDEACGDASERQRGGAALSAGTPGSAPGGVGLL